MATYSVGTTGAMNGSIPQVKTEKIDDAYTTIGGMQYAMSRGIAFNTQGLDGRIHNRAFDAERWTPATPILKPAFR